MPLTKERQEKVERVLSYKQPDLTVVLENVHDPHNSSAVLRTCDAVGILDVHIVMTVPPSEYKLGKKTSGSANKWLEICHWESLDDCFDHLRRENKTIMASSVGDTATNLYDMTMNKPLALVFGNEHEGISEEVMAKADGFFYIPQVGMIESLNISVACAVTLYEAFRQRKEGGFYSGSQLSGEFYETLRERWLQRAK